MLQIKNFTKIYSNGKIAVDNISLNVESGDIFAFIGPNGAGKTTTIKSVVGINDFDKGEILIDGIDIVKKPVDCKKIIAYIPDNPDIYDTLTGVQYLELVADIFRVSKEERNRLALEYAKLLGLEKDLNSPISTYSHGMKQKLVLISAFIHKPKLVVMDEPFVGLDPKASFTVKEIMKKFVKDGGAIFFSTHVLEVAEKLCNKVAIIKDGKIIACGTMEEVKKDKSLEKVFLESVDNEQPKDSIKE
ncbi:MAG: ABC transporter ATP-binding protein [Clostridia bacterium]|nr:ABC transporter ATP-binding protein [Clostridia bacterium]